MSEPENGPSLNGVSWVETVRTMLDISAEHSDGPWDAELVMGSLAKTRNAAARAHYWTPQMAEEYDLLREALCYLVGDSGYRDRGW